MLQGICQKFHQCCLQGKAVIVGNSVGAIKIIYQKGGVHANVPWVVFADKGTWFPSPKLLLHPTVKQELLVIPQKLHDSTKIVAEGSHGLNNQDVGVFFHFDGLHFWLAAYNGYNTTVMELGGCWNGGQD